MTGSGLLPHSKHLLAAVWPFVISWLQQTTLLIGYSLK
jgi:hypothetical protein